MNIDVDSINLLIAGDKSPHTFSEAVSSLESTNNIKKNSIKIWNLQKEYFQRYVNLIDEDGNYFNIIAVNYKTQKEILNFFYNFNEDYNETGLTTTTYPFFLINKNVYPKKDLYYEIIKINQKRPELYQYNSKDIIEYDKETLPKKIQEIYNYYYQKQQKRNSSKTLNIMVCGKKRTGKTYFINELLFENRGLSKQNCYTSKITSYEHKLFPIMFYDFPGFSDNEDRGMSDATNFIAKLSEVYKNIKDKIHIIFYFLQNDSGRVLQDKEIELIENFIKSNVPIFFITNRIEKNNYKTFIRNVEIRMKLIKGKFNLKELMSRLFILDSTNKSIKKLLDAVIDELSISKAANEIIIKELSQNENLNDSRHGFNDKKENFISQFEIIGYPDDEERQELKRGKLIEQMKKSIFFNDYSKTFRNVERKINEIIDKIQNETNTHLIPLLTAKKDLLKLFSELKTEFREFMPEEKIKKNFPALSEINEFDLDENSIGLLINAVICFFSVLTIGATGTFSLAFGIPIYLITGNAKKKKIETLLKENANNMFKKFKDISIDDYSIKSNAEDYNNIIDKFIQYSKCFDSEHLNDMDLVKFK
jgi:hypothetical protein